MARLRTTEFRGKVNLTAPFFVKSLDDFFIRKVAVVLSANGIGTFESEAGLVCLSMVANSTDGVVNPCAHNVILLREYRSSDADYRE